jgi:hypothetical protein
MTDTPCPECGGKCCRDEYGYRIAYMAAESYEHRCENCNDGFVPEPVWTAENERQAVVAWLRDDGFPGIADHIERGEHRREEET